MYGFLAAATPILLYIVFNRDAYTLYESSFLRDFWHAVQSAPFPSGIQPYTKQLWDCFFTMPGPRFFIPDTLPIPLPYYWLLVPGIVLALWQKRFEIPLLATIPVVGAFIAKAIENRLLLPIPFWVILMSFTVAWVLKLRPMARRANCCRRCGSANPAQWIGPVSSIHLRQDEKSVFDPPLCATGGRCLAFLKTCCSRTGTSRSSSPGTQRVQPNSRRAGCSL